MSYQDNINEVLDLYVEFQKLYADLKNIKSRKDKKYEAFLNSEKPKIHRMYYKSYLKEIVVFRKYYEIKEKSIQDSEYLEKFDVNIAELKEELFFLGIEKLQILIDIYVKDLSTDFEKYKKVLPDYELGISNDEDKKKVSIKYTFHLINEEYENYIFKNNQDKFYSLLKSFSSYKKLEERFKKYQISALNDKLDEYTENSNETKSNNSWSKTNIVLTILFGTVATVGVLFTINELFNNKVIEKTGTKIKDKEKLNNSTSKKSKSSQIRFKASSKYNTYIRLYDMNLKKFIQQIKIIKNESKSFELPSYVLVYTANNCCDIYINEELQHKSRTKGMYFIYKNNKFREIKEEDFDKYINNP